MTLTEEEKRMIEEAQEAVRTAELQLQRSNNQIALQSMMENEEKGIAEQQLDLGEELERIEHLLRGHILKRDEQGIYYWHEDPENAHLNEKGVRMLIQVITFYLSKRKLLSNYSEEQVNEKMYDFQIELATLIYMKYEEMGLDTPDKRKIYPMLVRMIVDSVHDIYLRALGGIERSSLRKRWNLNENIGTGLNLNQGGSTSLKSLLR